ncbi:ABC transporter ATP-binding protein [Geomesophilobacter sediminis]|uniref:ABC transporter ATP-binding protein n=1 Tax=Geomesophilobacter sediminis TaxID=2798584 RepID=A0A8J7JJZ8_9BACT|nr:ABC transporter ATP-binding protein [Geomesophilobacter sediminis]MBJ6723425.1 ABC transporter ATP-binding protein [Geomesophilobacter sediminis]
MNDAPNFLEVEQLTVARGGVPVIDIPRLSLAEGEVLSLIGPNGSGKSTLMLTLATLLPPTGGRIRCRGEAIDSDRARFAYRRRLAMVFQEPLLFDTTVFENVAAGLKIRRMTRGEIRSRVMETLELFSMAGFAERSASKLSGGESQRTSLARAFAIRPEMILLDEPFAALDAPTRLALTTDLERILTETGTAAIVATHDQLEALRLSTRMAVINRGAIVQGGTPAEVMNRPANEFVASFVGMENVLTGTVLACSQSVATVSLGGHAIELVGQAEPGESVIFCLRPENIAISTTDPAGVTSARNVIRAVVRKVIPMGIYNKIEIDCGFPLVAYLTSQSIDHLHLDPGKTVYASFKATAVHLLRRD